MGAMFQQQQPQHPMIDEAGLLGVKLQRMLVFLIIFNLFGLFTGAFLPTMLTLLLLLTGYVGAYKRHTGMLMVYFSISLFCMVATVGLGLVAIVYYQFVYAPQSDSQDSQGWNTYSSASVSSSQDAYNQGEISYAYWAIALAFVVTFVLTYVKVYSLMLAYRMRKVILRDAAPVHVDRVEEGSAPVTPQMFPQMFHGGYMPANASFNPEQAGQPMFYPMAGQQPVFYTFAHPDQLQGYPAPAAEKSVN